MPLTLADAAQATGLKSSTIPRAIKTGKISGVGRNPRRNAGSRFAD
jgi:hypothetical protein